MSQGPGFLLLPAGPSEGPTVLAAWAALTTYHILDGLNNRYLFFTVLAVLVAGKPKIEVLADSVSEGPLPGRQMATLSLYPYVVWRETVCSALFLLEGH